MKVKSEREVAQSRLTFTTPWTAAYQAPLSMGFSRQEYWSGMPLPSPDATLIIFKVFFFFFKIYLLVYFLAMVALHGCMQAFSSLEKGGLLSSFSLWASHCSGFYCVFSHFIVTVALVFPCGRGA